MKWNSLKLSVIILLFVLFFNFLFSNFNALYEIVYLKGLFQFIRITHDFTLGFLPIPNLYLTVMILLAFILFACRQKRKEALKSILVIAIWVVNLFYIFWAFNYNQTGLKDRLDLETSKVDSSYIQRTFYEQTDKLDSLLAKANKNKKPEGLESMLRRSQEEILKSWDIPTVGRVRVRAIPGGSLLHFRTSGIYIPHAFEGHLDAGLYEVQHPFTMAHEMAHGYGITDESECNFIAYLTCLKTDDVYVQYSAELAYWRYLAGYFRRLFPEEWEVQYEKLNPLLLDDLKAIREHVSRYKDWMPKYRDLIYDRYLKTHGVKAGIRSYDLMIVLIKAYREKSEGSTDPLHQIQ